MQGDVTAWSNAYMKDMLRRYGVTMPLRELSKLTVEQYNLLGDWLWYELHPNDERPEKFRLPPKFIDEYLPRSARPTKLKRKEESGKQPASTKAGKT